MLLTEHDSEQWEGQWFAPITEHREGRVQGTPGNAGSRSWHGDKSPCHSSPPISEFPSLPLSPAASFPRGRAHGPPEAPRWAPFRAPFHRQVDPGTSSA